METSQRQRQQHDPRHEGKWGPDLESVLFNDQIRTVDEDESSTIPCAVDTMQGEATDSVFQKA